MDNYDTLEEKILNLIQPSINHMGFEIVEIALQGGTGKKTLLISAEPVALRPMSLDDCADVSRRIAAILDVEDFISGAYNLEVSSPGLERPLRKPEDFELYSGFEAKFETITQLSGQKNFKGKYIYNSSTDSITVQQSGQENAEIPLHQVKRAKLVFSKELAEFMRKRYEINQVGN
jgi:ribosome maturation factor RimP